jgi:phenylacetate-coenzyme A ligase PaaK-like adenylate-forming protein
MKTSPFFSADYYKLSTAALETALQHVAAYENWRAFDPGSSTSIDNRFRAMPTISKKDLRERTWQNFIPAGMDIEAALKTGTIELVQTSGTIHEQVLNVWYQPWWDEAEAASWRYNSHTAALKLGKHREAILTSPMNTGILAKNGLLTFEERSLGRFLYLNEKINPSLWNDQLILRIIGELEIFQPVVLEANPSYLAKVARYAHKHNLQVFQPPVIIFTYENPGILARKHIQKAFHVPLISSYGSTEAGYVLMECEQGKLHQVSDSCRIDVEFMRPKYGYPHVGRLLLTTLTNPWRSLVRFDVGDLVQIDPAGICECGRNDGYICKEFAGRTADLTYTTDNYPVTTAMVESIINCVEAVADYQVFQREDIYHVHIVLEEAAGASPTLTEEIIESLLPLYGKNAVIKVHFVPEIVAEPSGKYRRTRSDIEPDYDQLFIKEAVA